MNLKQLENIKREKGDVSGPHHKCRNPVVCPHEDGPETATVERWGWRQRHTTEVKLENKKLRCWEDYRYQGSVPPPLASIWT